MKPKQLSKAEAKVVKAFAREVRLFVAVELATMETRDSLQNNILEAVCKSDPTVVKVLETYGVEVPC